jgi:hypothetical protein
MAEITRNVKNIQQGWLLLKKLLQTNNPMDVPYFHLPHIMSIMNLVNPPDQL